MSETKAVAVLTAGNSIAPIVPTSFEDAYRFANVVVKAGMAPKSLDTAEKAMVAIMHGLEVGLTPMAALQSIAVVNGMPTIWGDGALGLVRASGLLVKFQEWEDGETAHCLVQRAGELDTIERYFSQADAVLAGLSRKTGPWTQYPRRMRQMRARSWALRDAFADVLRGLKITEEVEDYPETVTADGEVLSRAARIVQQRREMSSGGDALIIEHTVENTVQMQGDPAAETVQEEEPAEDAAPEPSSFALATDWPGIEEILDAMRKSPQWASLGTEEQSEIRAAAYWRLAAVCEHGYVFDFVTNAQAWRCYIEGETDPSKLRFMRSCFVNESAWQDLNTASKVALDKAFDARVQKLEGGR